jgi:integrase
VGSEEAEGKSLVDDNKRRSADDAGSLVGLLEGQEPPFSQKGLKIPERDKLQMGIVSRQKVSFSWGQA